MKKFLACTLSAILLIASMTSCSFLNGGNGGTGDSSSSSSSKPAVPTIAAEVKPVVYDVDAIKEIEDTETGTVEGWMEQKTTTVLRRNP